MSDLLLPRCVSKHIGSRHSCAGNAVVMSQQGSTWKGLIPGLPSSAKASITLQTLVRVLRGNSLMGQEASKVLPAHVTVLGAHAHVGVPNEVHIHRGDAKDPCEHLSELKKRVIAGNDFLQLSNTNEQAQPGNCQAVDAPCHTSDCSCADCLIGQ